MKSLTFKRLGYYVIVSGIVIWIALPIIILRQTPFFISWEAFAMWLIMFISIRCSRNDEAFWLLFLAFAMLIMGVIGYFIALKYWDHLGIILGYWIPGIEACIAIPALAIILLRRCQPMV